MLKITLIGSGNLGSHLFQHWKANSQVKLNQWLRRSRTERTIDGVSCIGSPSEIEPADAYVMAVPDREIESLSTQLPPTGMAVHCSGSMSLDILRNKGTKGVLYPLQSFSSERQLNFNSIPFFLETLTAREQTVLQALVDSLSTHQYWLNSAQRLQLHLAAVFANNFTNHCYEVAGRICEANKIPFDVLLPLIHETASKVAVMKPIKAQTGPAIRNDQLVLEKHQSILKNKTDKQLYQFISQAIQNSENEQL